MAASALSERRNKSLYLVPFIVLPACLIGAYTMHYFNIPKSVWLANLIVAGLGILITQIVQVKQYNFKAFNLSMTAVLLTAFLSLTFFDKGMEGVHRWVLAGGLNLNAGLITCPIFLIIVFYLGASPKSFLLAAIITILLLCQPDASQVSAFSIPASILLWNNTKNSIARVLLMLLTLSCNAYVWLNLDTLKPVNYVESIVQLAGIISAYLKLAAFFSLALLPLPFFVRAEGKYRLLAVSLGLYFSITLCSAFIGHFPIMIMGYGISPIIGYFVGLNWLLLTIQHKYAL